MRQRDKKEEEEKERLTIKKNLFQDLILKNIRI